MRAAREIHVSTAVIVPVIDEGLGNSAYLADLGDGRALAIDVPRDLRAARAAAGRHGLRIAFAADTHLHADFLSGARQLAAEDGAQILAPAAGGRAYPHLGLADGDEVGLGGLTLRAWATPGHTAEHSAYLLLDGAQVLGVFTGGSLLVGAAARTDLSGAERTERLARCQYASLRKLLTLPDATPVYPTHGAGSFCSAPPGAERTTTIGREKAANRLLAAGDEDAFVTALLASLGTFPGYFLRLPEQNRRGPAVLPAAPTLVPLTTGQVRALQDYGAQVIDVRPVADYAAGHIPGSLAIALRPAFATWLGWLVPDPATPLIVAADPGQDLDEVIWQALKIGYENFAGILDGGVAAWQAAGRPVAVTPLLTPGQVDPATVIDVRQAGEYAGGHLPGSRNIELGALTSMAAAVQGRPVVIMCGHGERAATAASVLERAGHTAAAILPGGPADWAAGTGLGLESTA
jgi:hydroxyacylglutathione hydrolase